MPPVREYQKARVSQFDDGLATSNEDIAIGSEKYVCPTWSYHCRPSNPAPTDAGAPGNEDPSDRFLGPPIKDEVLVPREDSQTLPENTVLESEKYTCPPWSYHCRPDSPALIDTKASAQGSPSETFIEHQEEISAVVPREETSAPSESTVSESEKYTCSPSHHCRPVDPALIDTKAITDVIPGATYGGLQEDAKMVSRIEDIAPVPGNAAVSTVEDYVCPPWSYHCRPLNPASANIEAPSTNLVEKPGIEDAIIDKRSDAKAPHVLVPSPASIGPICTLSKDPSGVGFVEKCITLPLDDRDVNTYDFALIKRGGDDDLVADVLKQHDLKSILNSICLISFDLSTDKMRVICPHGELANKQSAIMNATTPANTCQLLRFENCNLEEKFILMLALGLMITAVIGLAVIVTKWKFKRVMKARSKRSKKTKIPRSAKPTYPVYYECSNEDSSDCYMGKTDLSKPGSCVVLEKC